MDLIWTGGGEATVEAKLEELGLSVEVIGRGAVSANDEEGNRDDL